MEPTCATEAHNDRLFADAGKMHELISRYSDVFSLATALGTFIAIVVGVVELMKARRDHANLKEEEFNSAYLAISDAYHRLLEMTIDYPHLGIWPWQEDVDNLSNDDRNRREMFYEMLISICERAWLERRKTTEIEDYFWPGWEVFLIKLLEKPSFRSHWEIDSGSTYGTYDKRFEDYARSVAPSLT